MAWKNVKISSFLNPREDRIKPAIANQMGLQRLKKIDFSGVIHLENNKNTKTDMIIIKSGDLVISGINVEKGALAVYLDPKDILATIHYSAYEYDKELVDINYLKWFFRSKVFRDKISKNAKGGIKTEIKPKHFLPLEILLPDLLEQKKIVRKIEIIESEINQLNNINIENENLISYLKKIISNDFLHNNLEDFKEYRLVDLIEDQPRNGYSPKSVNYKTAVKNLTLTATTSGEFNKDHFKYIDEEIPKELHFWLKQGDILIQRGNSLDYVGMTAIYTGKDYEFIYPDLMIKIRANEEIILKEYLHLVLISKNVRDYFKNNASGTSGSMPKINQKILLNTLIKVPNIQKQKELIEKINILNSTCQLLEEEIKLTKYHSEYLLQAILQEAFNPHENNKQSSNVIGIIPAMQKRALVSAEIITQLNEQKNFGAVKNEKLLYLFEKHYEKELGGNYIKMPAGPYDPDARYKVEEILKAKKWFNITKEKSNDNDKIIYNLAENHNEYKSSFDACFTNEEKSNLQEIIDTFKNKTKSECEAIATLYAVWNDFLIEAKDFNDDDIVNEFRNNWDESKKDFNPQDLRDYLVWMRSKGLIPRGQGAKTIEPRKCNLI